jgi:hypothetical protein
VLLGGLVTTTLLALFVLPALYLRFGVGAELEPAIETSPAPAVAAERSRPFGRAPEWPAGTRQEQMAETGANPPEQGGENPSPGRRDA